MFRYFKFRQDLFAPRPARPIYVKPGRGKGWPQECPALRAACAFGFDLPANFDVTFVQRRDRWVAEPDVVIESDFAYAADDRGEGVPLAQQYAWGWKKGQNLPHPISDHVYTKIRHQMKVSSFLFLRTDPGEMLLMTDVPNQVRPWRALTALVETDWYPASYPWHTVIELDPRRRRISIRRGEPLCRVIPVRRDEYAAAPMSRRDFDRFFEAGQRWLQTHGTIEHEGMVDIRGSYLRQQKPARFKVK
jgi:hypothetical protein